MSDYLRDRFPLDATDTVRMSGKQGYNLVRYGKPGIIAYVELFPGDAEAFREAVCEMAEAVRAEEREKAAQIAENAPGTSATGYYSGDHQAGYQEAQNWIAARIREQGEG